jgi:hypothetical protein
MRIHKLSEIFKLMLETGSPADNIVIVQYVEDGEPKSVHTVLLGVTASGAVLESPRQFSIGQTMVLRIPRAERYLAILDDGQKLQKGAEHSIDARIIPRKIESDVSWGGSFVVRVDFVGNYRVQQNTRNKSSETARVRTTGGTIRDE